MYLKVFDKSNSACNTAEFDELDPANWWVDTNWSKICLYVKKKENNDSIWHNVYCKKMNNPGLIMINNELYWVNNLTL